MLLDNLLCLNIVLNYFLYFLDCILKDNLMTNLYMMEKMDMVLIHLIMDYNAHVDENLFFCIVTKPFLFFIISSEDESSDISLFFFYLIKEYLIK